MFATDPSENTLSAENPVETADLIAVLRRRADTYALLARLYRVEVDRELLDTLHGTRFPASTGNALMDEGYKRIARYLSNVWAGSLEELAVDYVRTFIGHGNTGYSAAYPFESVYTSEKRLLMQEARDEVLAIMRSEGLDKASDWPDSEDHVALELEFMQTMASRAADALEEGDETAAAGLLERQQAFLADHLCSWTPMLTADMRNLAQTDLYQGLARLTDGYLQEDRALLASMLG